MDNCFRFLFKDCLLVLGCAHDELKQTLDRVAAEQAFKVSRPRCYTDKENENITQAAGSEKSLPTLIKEKETHWPEKNSGDQEGGWQPPAPDPDLNAQSEHAILGQSCEPSVS